MNSFPKFLILLEICFLIYWFITQTYITFSYDAVTNEKYRAAGLFIGIHSLISPAAILYAINSPDKPHPSLLWIFVITLLYDMIELFDVSSRLDQTIVPIAWNLQCASVIWTFSMSVLAVIWYLSVVINSEKGSKLGTSR
jgi:hypothetical protein